MAIDVTAVGGTGTHSFRRSNVNTVDNFIYFKNTGSDVIPSTLFFGTSFIYADGSGSVEGLPNNGLVYVTTFEPKKLTFSATSGGTSFDFTDYVSGGITFNTPIVYNNKVNIDSSTATNQAVKYYTDGDPLTGLTSGSTYFLKNVSVSDFAGQQSIYAFSSHNFTSCNQTGRTGPTLSQIRNAYSTAPWTASYINEGSFTGYQDWTVPVSGIYEFDVRGASSFTPSAITATITNTVLSFGTVTITTSAAHGLKVNQGVTIAGVANAVYNGNYIITSVPSTTTFRYARSNANIGSAAAVGTATLFRSPGQGARVKGRVTLTKGEIITIVVGQVGENGTGNAENVIGGAGGGTFVVRKAGNDPIFIAGGGSEDAGLTAGRNGVTTELGGNSSTGQNSGLAIGFGGSSAGGRSPGGGGLRSRGGNASSNTGGGSFLDGLTAVAQSSVGRIGGSGGFGGGGSGDGNFSNQAGGGGGYSGGGGVRTLNTGQVGGGGGSFINSLATNVATSDGQYDTSSTFNSVAITNLASYNSGDGAVAVSLISSFTGGNEVYPTAVDANAGTNKIAIAPSGSSYHAFVPINYDAGADLIYSAAAHGLIDGEAVTPTFNTIAPAGLSSNTVYYVNKVDNFSYRLSSTPAPTFTTINLTTPSGRSTSPRDKISRVVVNVDTNTLTITAHGFLVDQPIQYDNGSGNPFGTNTGSIAPLQQLTTYYVSEVLNSNQIRLKTSLDSPTSIDFTSAGTGTGHSFIFVTVNLTESSLYIPNHGLVNGQAVKYSNGGGTTIPGLTNNATYYIIKVDNSIVKLSSNPDVVNNPTVVSLDGVGTGTQSLIITSLDYATNIISIPGHGFLQKELVLYDAKGQTVIDGLTTNTPYYVIFIDGDRIKLATTPENADAGTAVDITDTPLGVGTHSLQSLAKSPDGIYTIATVPTANSFTVDAAGKVPFIIKTFNPRTAIDLNLSAFKLTSHGFLTGTKVTYDKGEAATVITGLTDLTDYFVVVINRDYLRLATTEANAESGTTLTVTDFGTGVGHKFTTGQINGNITGQGSVSVVSGSVLVNGTGTSFSKILKVGDRFRLFPPNLVQEIDFDSADINTTNNRITKVAHGFTTEDTIVFSAEGGVSPSPLVDGYYYFIRAVDVDTITLHSSAADAASNSNIVDITTTGTVGDSGVFKATRTTPVGPIIRRITAIGSDTQISVDRPYASAYSSVSYSYPTFIYVRPEGYSLHRPFDGGVEMSAGAGTSYAQIIRQTRKYFRYQSGKGLQTSCGINFKPSIDIESMLQFSSTTIEVKTRRPHGLISGLSIQVSEAKDSFGDSSTVYNGSFQVTVVDLTTFRVPANGPIVEARAYGFPQFYVVSWQNGAVRTGMFDFQNGMFFEYDGQKVYAVRRSSTQQMAGTVAALQGNEVIFGTGTSFSAQLVVGDYVVMRGQSYRVVQIDSQTRMSVRPEYKGSSASEKEFNPQTAVNTSTSVFTIIGHGLSQLLPVVYNSIDGVAIGGLINGRTYYVELIDNNSFKLKASPDAAGTVTLSSTGTTTVHSLTPAKSGIIVTKTVDTKIPQEDWSLDPCDGTGITGYNLDLSKIQMAYIDYSWYGAGKIRFGFKTTDGQVQYVHEFVHNNNLFESYFRSGNLPARYEVLTYENPTYIPSLFHWGTSVMMDGRFDDDNAYLFTGSSQTLNIAGTTAKSFASNGIDLTTDLFTVQSHGFTTGDVLEFHSVGSNGLEGSDLLNPTTQVIGSNTLANLTNSTKYRAFVNSANLIHLTPLNATILVGGTVSRTGSTVTVVTNSNHNLTTGMYVGIYGIASTELIDANGPYYVTRVSDTEFTYTKAGTAKTATVEAGLAVSEVINFTSQGNTQFTYFLYPEGSFNNTSGPNYQPLLSIRLSPSVSEGLTGKLGDRDVINRMQLRLKEISVSTNQLVEVKILLNSRLNNLGFIGVDSPSLTQTIEHTAADTVSGGVQVYNFLAAPGGGGADGTTTVDVSTLFELSNSILGGDSIYPDGPDILTIAVSRLTGNSTLSAVKLSWSEAQA